MYNAIERKWLFDKKKCFRSDRKIYTRSSTWRLVAAFATI
jgi:hypothetical protein